MGEKRFELDYDDEYCACISNFVDNGEKLTDREVVDLLNKLYEENEKLRKQMQNYEQLIANSYMGIEETVDGFVGKYVIWEDELQKCRKKTKKVVDDEYGWCKYE